DLRAPRLTAPGVISARNLERKFVGFAAAIGEGKDRLVAGYQLRQALTELCHIDMRDAGVQRYELELSDLLGHLPRDLAPAVPDLASPEVAARIQQPIAVLIHHIRAIPGNDHLRIARRIFAFQR